MKEIWPYALLAFMALFVWSLLEQWQKMLLAFAVCGIVLAVCIYNLNKPDRFSLKSVLLILIGLLSTIGLLKILFFFMTTYVWILILIAAVCFILEVGFVIVIVTKIAKFLYKAFKKA